VSFLKERANTSWQQVEKYLSNSGSLNNNVKAIYVHWINNTFSAKVTPDGLKTLAQTPGVKKIYLNRPMQDHEPAISMRKADATEAAAMPYDFTDIGLDK